MVDLVEDLLCGDAQSYESDAHEDEGDRHRQQDVGLVPFLNHDLGLDRAEHLHYRVLADLGECVDLLEEETQQFTEQPNVEQRHQHHAGQLQLADHRAVVEHRLHALHPGRLVVVVEEDV